MAQQPPEFLRVGRLVYTRRQVLTRTGLFVAGIATGVAGTLLEQYLVNTHQEAQEVVSPTEIVRGTVVGAFDAKGNLITNSLVPTSQLIMVVREVAAPNYSIKSVVETAAFKDFDNPFPTVAKTEQPNFGSNYLFVADLDALQGGVPKNTPFQVSYNVNFVGPDGQVGTKLNDPGPLQFTRV